MESFQGTEASEPVFPSKRIHRVFRALAHPVRRQILRRIARREHTVTENAKPFKMSLEAVWGLEAGRPGRGGSRLEALRGQPQSICGDRHRLAVVIRHEDPMLREVRW